MRAFEHPVVSMFFGCIPIGLATIINGLVIFGDMAASAAAYLWWADAAFAVLSGVTIPFSMFTRQEHAFEHMSAIWLLPIVACEVTVAIPHIAGAASQMTVLFASYALWASFSLLSTVAPCSRPMISAFSLVRCLAPPSSVLCCSGRMGSGGSACRVRSLPAICGTVALQSRLVGLHFPLGVYALATLRLSALLPITAIGILGDAMVAALVAIWLLVAGRTCLGAAAGTLFSDPSLQE
jgi:tellurite resistance protein TehA-like permease